MILQGKDIFLLSIDTEASIHSSAFFHWGDVRRHNLILRLTN